MSGTQPVCFATKALANVQTGEDAVIRQAISCDICGAEKKQTNHWYVACEQGGEMRLGGWNSRMRQRSGAKHLCGQTCLHKLVDEFMARTVSGRVAPAAGESAERAAPRAHMDASLTSPVAYVEVPRQARLVSARASDAAPEQTRLAIPPVPAAPMQPQLVSSAPVPIAVVPSDDDAPNYSSRRWRAEAWERERNRELRAIERHPELARRHKIL
jgi:hypothetical protein